MVVTAFSIEESEPVRDGLLQHAADGPEPGFGIHRLPRHGWIDGSKYRRGVVSDPQAGVASFSAKSMRVR